MLTSSAPAKLILAGEHAVIYGSPAITTRLNWQTYCDLSLSTSNRLGLTNATDVGWTSAALDAHWLALKARHRAWQTDRSTPLLKHLADLPLAVFAWWQQHYVLPTLNCQIRSDIPIGQGLGSSASLIIALLRGLSALTETALSHEDYQSAGTELENLAHGKSSGLDVAAILTGDRTSWQHKNATVLPYFPLTGYLINTGKAQSNTADCVGYVRQHHQDNQALWQDFSQITLALQAALIRHNSDEINRSVAHIQTNLCKIGVVPARVQTFTKLAQQDYGWNGKLCGAGSISGDGGGFFWLLADKEPKSLCEQFGYDYWLLSELSEKNR
jgi:mevalonate kinase